MIRILAVTAVVFSMVGCASAPPVKAIQDARAIADTWEGTVYIPNATQYVLTVKPDGTWDAKTPQQTFTGTYTVSGGTATWKSKTTGNTGNWTLREGDGKRVLIIDVNGRTTGELTPVKK